MNCRVWEEVRTAEHEQLGLLLITPQKTSKGVWNQFGLDAPEINDEFIKNLPTLPKNNKLKGIIEKHFHKHPERFKSACQRLRLAHVSWQDFHQKICSLLEDINHNDSGQQTLYRLLKGFDNQLLCHPGTGVTPPMNDIYMS